MLKDPQLNQQLQRNQEENNPKLLRYILSCSQDYCNLNDLGQTVNWFMGFYGKILKRILPLLPDYPTQRNIYEAIDMLEGIKFEQKLKLLNEHNKDSVIEDGKLQKTLY